MQNKTTETTQNIILRNEHAADYRAVEELTRKAFWNLYIPGCVEHYLVHLMRSHPDFLPELSYVLEVDGQILGNVMYTKAWLVGETGEKKEILTFGPLSVLPGHQRLGYGKKLLEHSFETARALGYEVIVIMGSPGNYVGRGFKSCLKHRVAMEDGSYPTAMLVKELRPGALGGQSWVYQDSPVMHLDEAAAQRFDEDFSPMEKKWQPSQEEFFILSHSLQREMPVAE